LSRRRGSERHAQEQACANEERHKKGEAREKRGGQHAFSSRRIRKRAVRVRMRRWEYESNKREAQKKRDV
jgi:hypothetical protein